MREPVFLRHGDKFSFKILNIVTFCMKMDKSFQRFSFPHQGLFPCTHPGASPDPHLGASHLGKSWIRRAAEVGLIGTFSN